MKQMKKQKLARWCAALICLCGITGYFVPELSARYKSADSEIDQARVAIFGHNESIHLPTDWTSTLVPGNTRKFTLTVSNQTEDGAVSEVAQTYELEVVTAGNLPLTYTLTREETTIGTYVENSTEKSHTFSDAAMTFDAGAAKTDTYQLTASWPETENDASLAGVPDFIQINIHVEQKD